MNNLCEALKGILIRPSISIDIVNKMKSLLATFVVELNKTNNSDWLVCCLLVDPDLWKRMPLKWSNTMVFTCPPLS